MKHQFITTQAVQYSSEQSLTAELLAYSDSPVAIILTLTIMVRALTDLVNALRK